MISPKILTYVALFVFLSNYSSNSVTLGETKLEIGVAPGMLFSGDVYISLYGDNVQQNSNFLIRSYADAYVIPQISFGFYFNYSTLNLNNEIEVFGNTIKKSGTPIWEIGGSIKPRFNLSEKFALKPGFNIGHRQFSGEDDFTTWKGLALNGSCELQYCFSEQFKIITETGFLYQPYGGNKDTDVTFDPIFYLVFGIGL